MENVIVGGIILAIIIPAVKYIIKAKKKGQVCIGYPNGTKCSGKCHCNQ